MRIQHPFFFVMCWGAVKENLLPFPVSLLGERSLVIKVSLDSSLPELNLPSALSRCFFPKIGADDSAYFFKGFSLLIYYFSHAVRPQLLSCPVTRQASDGRRSPFAISLSGRESPVIITSFSRLFPLFFYFEQL